MPTPTLKLSPSARAAIAQLPALSSAFYQPGNDEAILVPTQATAKKGYYALVYTANTGCDGPSGSNGRHHLQNIGALAKSGITINYINTNYWSENPNMPDAVTPLDFKRDPVPGKQIATVAQSGNSTSEATILGKSLLSKYNLNAFSPEVVLVHVSNPDDHRQDRVVSRFNNTFDANFVANVQAAAKRDQAQQQGRTGVPRT